MINEQRKEQQMANRVKGKEHAASTQPGSRRALGAVSLNDVANALQDGRRVAIMCGRIDLKAIKRPHGLVTRLPKCVAISMLISLSATNLASTRLDSRFAGR